MSLTQAYIAYIIKIERPTAIGATQEAGKKEINDNSIEIRVPAIEIIAQSADAKAIAISASQPAKFQILSMKVMVFLPLLQIPQLIKQ